MGGTQSGKSHAVVSLRLPPVRATTRIDRVDRSKRPAAQRIAELSTRELRGNGWLDTLGLSAASRRCERDTSSARSYVIPRRDTPHRTPPLFLGLREAERERTGDRARGRRPASIASDTRHLRSVNSRSCAPRERRVLRPSVNSVMRRETSVCLSSTSGVSLCFFFVSRRLLRGAPRTWTTTSTEQDLRNVNDPSAGSPTETLLRLLLPLNDQVWSSSRQHRQCRDIAAHQSEDLTKSFNR